MATEEEYRLKRINEMKKELKEELDINSLIRLYVIARKDFETKGISSIMDANDFEILINCLKIYSHKQTRILSALTQIMNEQAEMDQKHY